MGYNRHDDLVHHPLAVAGGESPLGYNRRCANAVRTAAVAGGESPLGYNSYVDLKRIIRL
mgnify:CR=1 FL=1